MHKEIVRQQRAYFFAVHTFISVADSVC